MKDWNRTGKIKAILLAVFSVLNLISPFGVEPQQGLFASILMPLIFGSIAIPIISKLNQAIFGREIGQPHWNDNPLTLKKPLSFFHFGAFLFLSVGLSMVAGTAIKFQTLNLFGLTAVSFGIGILVGIILTLKWLRK